jgi:hypothetical protein
MRGVKMEAMRWLVAVILTMGAWQASAKCWDLSEEEKNSIRADTLCYSIGNSGYFELDMCRGCGYDGEFDRLEVIAMKDEKGSPVLPYRVKVFKGEGVREIALVPRESRAWKTSVERMFVSQDPMIGIGELGAARDEGNAVADGIAQVERTNGLRRITLLAPRYFVGLVAFNVEGEGCDVSIAGAGTRTIPQWHIFDDGLTIKHMNCVLMEPESKFIGFFSHKKYICSWALYQSEESKSGWEERASGKENRFVLNVRIWKASDELTRANALCIARAQGCLKIADEDVIKTEFEKGGDRLRVDLDKGPLGETSRIMRLRFEGLVTSVHFPPDDSIEILHKRVEDFKRDYRGRVHSGPGNPKE